MTPPSHRLQPSREITDTLTLKALSDPIRLALLRALMRGASSEPRLMSVKELAQELGEPQTRLYRHVKQLEAAGLIQAAQSRLVSGIVEHRYRAAQTDLRLSPEFIHDTTGADQLAAAAGAAIDDFRRRLLDTRFGSGAAPLVVALDTRMAPDRAAEFRTRLKALVDEYTGGDDTDDGSVPVDFLAVLAAGRPAEDRPEE